MSLEILTDSASNLTDDLLEKYGIHMLSCFYLIDDVEYPCYVPGRDYAEAGRKFYHKLRNKVDIKTSLINTARLIEFFEPFLQAGRDILFSPISSGLSGTFQAAQEAARLAARNEKAAEEREERLVSAAQMEARKTLLTAKQEMVERAYQRALEKLRSLPQEQYVELLAALLVRASSTGREEVVFSPEDREGAGKAAVARANELLAKEAAPELPLGDGVVANLLNKVAAGVSAFAQGTAMLAVSEETRDISGGFILKDGRIEVNCTFDALVRAEREQTAGEVAKLLFPEA